MIKTLMGSIRDYMKVTVATPLLVLGEVLCEMLIPFITANLIDAIKDGTTVAEMLPTAGFLVLIALTSLAFGAAAGVTCSHASCGFAKNLRHDLFYKIQTFSFANIDEFSSSSLVTRLTTDINNVQQAFMMIIRIAVRAPLVFGTITTLAGSSLEMSGSPSGFLSRSTRRSATVTSSEPAASMACRMMSCEPNFPVPMKRRE